MATITNNKHDNWALPNSNEDEDQEESLSFCDLPTNDHDSKTEVESPPSQIIQTQEEDFDFGSWSAESLLTQPEMCAADDVFFQGKIRPLRHSISSTSDSGLPYFRQESCNNMMTQRSMSMDHRHSQTGFISSRSSSLRSINSASSGSVSDTKSLNYYKHPKIINQFHSHPSPTPQIRIPTKNHIPNRKSSTMWRFFQVGILQTPEIELKNLKLRSKSNTIHPFGSRNSNSSISTSSSIANVENSQSGNAKKKKLFGISCKCSVDAVESVLLVKNKGEKEELLGKKKKKKKKGKESKDEENVQGKQLMSRHRTFEWLKQLSLQEGGGGGGGGGVYSNSKSDHV